MEIIQEIGSYAGFAAVLGLAVLSALYFSQARDVKRLREWAGRAPERTTAPEPAAQPQRVVAKPMVRPGTPAPGPAVTRPPGPAPATPAAQPAQASAAGATPAVATGPAPATPAAKPSAAPDEGDVDEPETNGDAGADTGEHETTEPAEGTEPATPPADRGDESTGSANGVADGGEAEQDDESQPTVVADALPGDPDESDETGEWSPETEHSDFDFTDEHDAVPAATPLPPRPPQPFPRRGGAVPAGRQGRGSILPPYAESRPTVEPGGSGSPRSRKPILLALAGVLALAVVAFGVLQVTGGDDSDGGNAGLSSAPTDGGGDPNAPIDPSSVTVAVLNGTVQPGLAAQIGDQIAGEGFVRGVVTNNSDQERAESVVLYAPGAEREAIDVSRRLDIPQREPIDAASQSLAGDATVVVIAGADQIQ